MDRMLPSAAAHPGAPGRALRTAWAWTAVATLLLLTPLPEPLAKAVAGSGSSLWDKAVHAALLFFVVRAWLRTLMAQRPLPAGAAGRAALGVALAGVAYGGLIELAQAGLFGRVAEWGDLAADAAGAAAAWAASR